MVTIRLYIKGWRGRTTLDRIFAIIRSYTLGWRGHTNLDWRFQKKLKSFWMMVGQAHHDVIRNYSLGSSASVAPKSANQLIR